MPNNTNCSRHCAFKMSGFMDHNNVDVKSLNLCVDEIVDEGCVHLAQSFVSPYRNSIEQRVAVLQNHSPHKTVNSSNTIRSLENGN